MSRNRVLIGAAVVVLFVIAGGILIYRATHAAQNVSFDVTVTGGKAMSPSTISVHQNDMVTINIKSDKDGEVHLHDYDIHFETKAGKTVSQTFKADKTGTHQIEWESTSTDLGELVVSP